jgi:hypothetical protein
MGHVAAWALSLSLLPLLNISAGQPPSTLVVVLAPEGPHTAEAIAGMRMEAARLLAAEGIDLDWREPGAGSTEFAAYVAMIALKGRCRMEPTPVAMAEATSLGRTYTSNGAVIPFGEVECDSVRAAVNSALHKTDLARSGFLYGRALGRVLAHELYHIAHRTAQHGEGFTQPAFSGRELVGDSGSILVAARSARH